MSDELIYEVKNLEKTFDDGKTIKVYANRNINLKVHKGDFMAIIGPSGSGKSTLLNIISGLDTATSGDVILSGKKIADFKGSELATFRRDHIGFIFQSYNLIPVLTVEENVEYVLVLQGMSKEKRTLEVTKVLDTVGLAGYEKRFPSELSGGQQQRVAVARAIISKPDIVLADEPTANLDSKTGESLIEMMLDLNEKYNTTFIFSTHDQMIMKKAKRLVTLKDGEIISDERK